MENNGYTAYARERQKLNVYIDKQASSVLEAYASSALKISKKSSAQYSISLSQNSFILENLISNSKVEFSSEVSLIQFLESIRLESNINNSNIVLFKSELNKILKTSHNIGSFIEALIRVSFFKSYANCQFLVHEKGASAAHSYSIVNSQVINNSFAVTNFNTIFQKIKKSKNKQFSINDIQSEDIRVVGSFLAKEFEVDDYNFIIILSRGDFFNTSQDEKDIFSNFTQFLKPYITTIIYNSLAQLQEAQVKKIIENFPIYLSVIFNSEKILSTKNHKDTITIQFNDGSIEVEQQSYAENEASIYHREKVHLMGELLNTLKHELSNPLFGINIAAEMLSMSASDENKDLLLEVQKGATRCQKIIDNFSALYLDKNENQKISLKNLIEETLILTKSESKFYKKLVTFKNCDDILVNINPTYLSQIIFNLVINSSQALKDYDVDNSLKCIQIIIEDFEKEIIIDVIDNGPGITKEKEKDIFTPFYTTKNYGTGLGLSICNTLVNKLEGSISIHHEYSNQTCFRMHIPKK